MAVDAWSVRASATPGTYPVKRSGAWKAMTAFFDENFAFRVVTTTKESASQKESFLSLPRRRNTSSAWTRTESS